MPSSSIQSSKLHSPSGSSRERGARQALGIVDRSRCSRALGLLGAVARHQLGELLLGDVAGGELRAQVAEHLHRQAHVLLDERHDGLVELARLVELHRRDAQPFGVDLGGIGGVRAGDPAADIGVVADRAGEGQPLALVVERLEDEDVGQVHAAVERVVHDEDVARRHVVAEVAHDRRHRRRHRARDAPAASGPARPACRRRRQSRSSSPCCPSARPSRWCGRRSAPSRRRSRRSRS